MARYAYDVNTTQRYIDVHKQFQGGLKTVDTDDALGAVFLREAENVSISEFGFLEKRYGTYENFKQTVGINANSKLQGYWEFEGYIIYAVDGDIFVNGTQINNFHTEAGLRYPTNDNIPFNTTSTCAFVNTGSAYLEPTLASVTAVADPSTSPNCGSGVTKISCVCENFVVGEGCVQWSCQNSVGTLTFTTVDHFQRTRDMNAVNINRVLYIFTGTYPIYAKVVSEELKFYLFPVTVPTFDEIVVTGHNLLEDDYEGLYFTNDEANLIPANNTGTSQIEFITLEGQAKEVFPKLPFVFNEKTQEQGSIDFSLAYRYNPDTVGFDNVFENIEGNELHFLQLSKVLYRNSGAGASSLDFIEGNLEDVTSNILTNISDDLTEDFVIFDNELLPKTELSETQLGLTRGSGAQLDIPIQAYFTDNAFINNETDLLIIGKEHNIKKEFNINKLDLDFEKKYAIQFEFLKTEDDPETGEDETLYEVVDFENLKQGVIDFFQDVYEDTTLRYESDGGFPITETIVRPNNFLKLNYYNDNKNNYKVVITPYNSSGAPFGSKTTISFFNIEYINKSYIFKIPESIFQSEDVSYYGITFENKVYYLNRSFYGPFVSSYVVLDENYTLAPFNLEATLTEEKLYLKVNTVFEIKNIERAYFGTSLLYNNLKNLLAGLYDFRFNYELVSYKLENDVFNKTGTVNIISDIFYNIQITQEKLQDFPRKDANSIGIEYPTLKPIWTCNKVTEHFGKLMVWGSQEMPTAVFYSFPDRPSYFPSKFFLDFTNDQNSPVEAVSSYMNILVVQTRDQTWGIRGNSGLLTAPAPYAPFTINPTVGTIAYKSVRAVRNHLFFLSKQGIIALKSLYAADEQYNIEFVDRNILNIVPRDDDSAVGIQFDNQYWLNFPKQRITLRWYIDKKAWVKDTYTAWNQFNGVFKYQIVDGKLEFITYPSLFDGENLGVYKIGVDYSLPTDLGADVVALFETAFLNQNYPFHPKNYKETKMDFTVQNEYNLGRDPIYTMETNEDINENQNLHTLVAPNLTKNHRYQLKYEAYIIDGGAFDTDFTNLKEVDGGAFTDTLTRVIDAMGIYKLGIGAINLQSTPQSTNIPFTEISETTYEFLLANNVPIGKDLTIAREFIGYSGGAALTDITYDHVLDFRTWIISEDNTLNLDNMEGYDQSKAEIPIQLGAKFGDWVFGLSDLGNKVTAIKTIKLAGRGYNVKVYFEDYSKSKWTLESLGITYKMKRPRSR